TFSEAPPPVEMNNVPGGSTEKLGAQPTLAWLTVTDCPATVMEPVRRSVPGLGATVNRTGPSPAPASPAVTVIQLVLLVAAQLQSGVESTVSLLISPSLETAKPVWLSV